MRKIILVLLTCIGIALFPCISFAQVSQARFDSLAAVVAKMQRDIGPYGDSIPPSADFPARCPALPNGRYSVWCRVQQIGLGIDENNVRVDAAETLARQVSVQAAAVSAKVDSFSAPTIGMGNLQLDALTVTHLRVTGKTCLGDYDCDPEWNAALQIRGNGDANIGLESNKNGQQSQSPRAHVAQINLSTDGGARFQQNCQLKYAGYTCSIDPCREATNTGTDSRGEWSFYRISVDSRANPFTGENCTPLPHDATQDFVLTTDEVGRATNILLWRPNWEMVFRLSSCIYCADKTYIVPKQ